jgi:hypothetical protein
LCLLTFTHPEFSPDISHNGLPIISHDDFLQLTHDQLNNRLDLLTAGPGFPRVQKYSIVESGNVRQYVTRVMRLMRGRLLKQDNWTDWQNSEYLQLNQYYDQGCFGTPTGVDQDDSVFHLVWTYNIKAVDGRKKARCVCDGSSQSGSVKVLDEVYANCVDQTSARLFYAVAAAENLLVFGSDVCNAFAEAPPPKQGFYIRPDRAFNEWWENYKGQPPIPPGHVIPVLSAMQGHPNRTEQLRKLGKNYWATYTSLTKMESSYATSERMRRSVAVGTAERGRLSSKRFSCLGTVQLPLSGVDHMLYGG